MKKNKIMAIVLSGAIVASMTGVTLLNKVQEKNSTNISIKNNVLLANPNQSASKNACVINGNGNLILTNKQGGIIGYISVGQMLSIQGTMGNKSLVTVQETGETGYIDNSNILSITNGDINNITKINSVGSIINVSNIVNLRKGPSMNDSIIEGLTNNTSVKIIGKTGQWYKVSVNGVSGYIFGEYIAKVNNSTVSTSSNEVVNASTSKAMSNYVNSTTVNAPVTVKNNSNVTNVTSQTVKSSVAVSKIENKEPTKSDSSITDKTSVVKPNQKTPEHQAKKEQEVTTKVIYNIAGFKPKTYSYKGKVGASIKNFVGDVFPGADVSITVNGKTVQNYNPVFGNENETVVYNVTGGSTSPLPIVKPVVKPNKKTSENQANKEHDVTTKITYNMGSFKPVVESYTGEAGTPIKNFITHTFPGGDVNITVNGKEVQSYTPVFGNVNETVVYNVAANGPLPVVKPIYTHN